MAFSKRNRQKSEDASTSETTASVAETSVETVATPPQQENTVSEAQTEVKTEVTAEAPATDSRFKKIRVDGVEVSRPEYIRKLWNSGMSRGAIAKKLTELNSVENGGDGKKIPYQVVFAVIKKGGTKERPDPGRDAAPAAAPAVEAQASA